MPQAQITTACLCAFGVALINNCGFCVVVAASQHLADKVFFAPNLLTLFTFSANLACFAATFLNARFLIKFSVSSRIRGVCIALLVGYGMLAVAVLLHGEAPICMDPIAVPRYFSRLRPRERCEWMGHVWMARPNYLVRLTPAFVARLCPTLLSSPLLCIHQHDTYAHFGRVHCTYIHCSHQT